MTGHKFRRPDKDRHTFKHLVKRVRYNDETGLIERVGINYKGKVGNIKSTGYMRIKIDGIDYLYHHIVWMLCKKKWPLEINHLDGDKLNCAIENLEDCTRKANQTHALGKPCAAFVGGKKVAVFPSIVDAAAWAKVRYQSLAKAIKTGEVKAGYRWRAA